MHPLKTTALAATLALLACSGGDKDSSSGGGGGETDTVDSGGAGPDACIGNPAGSDGTWTPDLACPGDASGACDSNTGAFSAGAAAVAITPACFESWEDLDLDGEFDSDEAYFDCGCDRLCPGDEGYTAPDEGEADGDFQASWLAGFHNNRPAIGVHDDLWARAVVFEQGETRVGLVVVDLVGWFYDDVVMTRQLAADAGLDLDLLIISSTHNHEAPDTMGLWGRSETSGGYDPAYGAFIREQVVVALQDAQADLREVGRFVVGVADASDYSERGAAPLIRDTRDPKVIDTRMRAALIEDASGETIATLSHFGNHPEAIADENVMITSDFPAGLRDGLEARYGGTSVFINGPVGGLMTPLGTTITDAEGTEYRAYTFEKLEVIGQVMADLAGDAIDGGAEITPSLSVATTRFCMPVDNYGFQALFLSEVLVRSIYDFDPTLPIEEDSNVPRVESEMTWLDLGGLEMLTVPGELFPELAIGGYDGSWIGDPSLPIVDEDNPNPPDLSAAPAGPYLVDRLSGDAQWIIGLGNDQVGYIVPTYDFELDAAQPWFEEAEGDHYEETNSLGAETAPIIDGEATQLMDWVDSNLR